MTLSEKISQLGSTSPAINRLGIPSYNYWNEALHGVVATGTTSFPQALALSSTWNRDLIFQVATAISDEARVKNNLEVKGLTYWSPTINMARDPRWGRNEETYGEDPWLTAQLARSFIHGMQGPDSVYLKVVSTVKHFACNNVEFERKKISSNVDERSLREYYLPAFKSSIMDAGVYSIMSAYNALNEVPCPVNTTLLEHILRDEWGFSGYVVSDCDAVSDVWASHVYLPAAPDATALSIKSGTDLNCGETYQYFTEPALSAGIMNETDVDTALIRILKARFLLGEFDPPNLVPYKSIPDSMLDCRKHRDLAIKAAQEAIVLLKNQNGILPLDRDSLNSIAVIGPNAGVVQLGGYSGVPNVSITPLQGIVDKLAGLGKTIRYSQGCSIQGPLDTAAFWEAVNLADNSDVAVVVCGTDLFVASEDVDRTSLDLPGIQDSLIREVLKANPRTIVVLVTGSPLSIRQINDKIPGIICAWYNGQAQGTAIADVLFGDYNPGGKLTSTWYQSVTDLPPMDHYDIKENRTYQYFSGTPLYPFGYGLSYTAFEYSNLTKSTGYLHPDDSLTVSVTVKNRGLIAGDEVPQFYIHHHSSQIKRPIKELKGFQRISLQSGESKTVTFTVKHEDLAWYDEVSRYFLVDDGVLELMVGSSSDDILLTGQIQVQSGLIGKTYRQDPLLRMEAESFEKKSKPLIIVSNNKGGQSIRINAENDYTVYRNMDFGDSVGQFEVSVLLDSASSQVGILEVRLDSLAGLLAGLMVLNPDKQNGGYQKRTCLISNATGIHDLFLVFKESVNGFCKMDWFVFQKTESSPGRLTGKVQLYPNPSSTHFTLALSCTANDEILVDIVSVDGVRIKSFRQQAPFTGINKLFFNTSDAGLEQGMYLLRCSVGDYRETRKLVVVRQ
jgi:beta-glucosidase